MADGRSFEVEDTDRASNRNIVGKICIPDNVQCPEHSYIIRDYCHWPSEHELRLGSDVPWTLSTI